MNKEELKVGVVIDDLPTGKLACGFKMSDVFRLPVSTDFEVCQIVNHDKNAFGAELKYKHHVFSAINNHDRLEQEVAELREAAARFLESFGEVERVTHISHRGRTKFLKSRKMLRELLNK